MAGSDSYTVLLIQSETTDGSTTFYDSSQYSHTVTGYGDTHHETAISKFGNSSIQFGQNAVGPFNDCLSVPSSSDFAFGTGSFCVDFWENPIYSYADNGTSNVLVSTYESSGPSGFYIYLNQNSGGGDTLGAVIFGATNTASISYNTSLAWQFYHIALTFDGTTLRLFLDGTLVASSTTTIGSISCNHALLIHGHESTTGTCCPGAVEEFRISKGNSRWTANFTPQTVPYDAFDHGYGEFNTPAPWLSSVGYNPILGYGEFNTPSVIITAAEMSLGYVEIDTPAVSLTAIGLIPIYGSVEFDTKKVSLASIGINQVLGFCNINTKPVVLAAQSGGDVLMRTSKVELDSTGVMAYPGFGEINTPKVRLTSYGTQGLYATVNMTPALPRLKSTSRGDSGFEVITYRR